MHRGTWSLKLHQRIELNSKVKIYNLLKDVNVTYPFKLSASTKVSPKNKIMQRSQGYTLEEDMSTNTQVMQGTSIFMSLLYFLAGHKYEQLTTVTTL